MTTENWIIVGVFTVGVIVALFMSWVTTKKYLKSLEIKLKLEDCFTKITKFKTHYMLYNKYLKVKVQRQKDNSWAIANTEIKVQDDAHIKVCLEVLDEHLKNGYFDRQ